MSVKFSLPVAAPPPIRWTIEHQIWAFMRGFAVLRGPRERAVLTPMSNRFADEQSILDSLERMSFQLGSNQPALRGDARLAYTALRFYGSQLAHGYLRAWEHPLSASEPLRAMNWFRHAYANKMDRRQETVAKRWETKRRNLLQQTTDYDDMLRAKNKPW